jgi:hypothetical protein
MKKRMLFISFLSLAFIIASSSSLLHADVPVAILPLEGNRTDCAALESKIRQKLVGLRGISPVGDNEMKGIMDLHEKAMAMGSSALDVSKVKVAEYVVRGSVNSGKANLAVISVNTNLEIFNKTFDFPGSGAYALNRELTSLRDSIMVSAYSSGEKSLPSGTAPYMQSARNLVQSLGMGPEASYPYIAFYNKGQYAHPDPKNEALVRQAKLFLDVVRPKLVRAELIFAGIEAKAPFMHLYIFADKAGAKTKHRLDFMDLPDGSLGITQYQPE